MSPASTSRQTEVRVRRAPGNHRSRRSWIAAGVSLGLLIGLIVLGISKLDPAAVAGSLTSIDASWVLLAVTLMGGSFLARAESWFIALRAAAPDAPVGRSAVRRALLIGMATSTVAPGRLGEAARAWIIARRIGDQREVIATVAGTVLFQTLLNLFALTILAVIALSDPAITHASIAGLMVALALPVSLVSVLLVAPKALGRAARSHHLWLRAAAEWLARQLVNARRGLAAFRQARAAAHTTIAQLTGWTLQLGTCYALVLALHLGGKANLAAAAAVLVAVNLTAIVPLTPSNVGVFQAACIAALAPFGVAASQGLAYGILLQAVEVFCALSLGAPALLREGLSWSLLRRELAPVAPAATVEASDQPAGASNEAAIQSGAVRSAGSEPARRE